MYKYETHLHTYPVSKCAKAGVSENLEFYKELGYDGVFITNHFLDGNINADTDLSYAERIEFYFSDYEAAVEISVKTGIKVFCGVEISYKGTDFLIYGLNKAWFLKHPEIMDMKKSEELPFLMENDALVIQAHPFREAGYIDHIRLFPRCVHGVEVINACRTDEQNEIARLYAKHYELVEFAGTDNHQGREQTNLTGMCCDKPIIDEKDFVMRVKNREMKIFSV